MNQSLTLHEIRIAIKDLKNNKASGIDEIIYEYLKEYCISNDAFIC